MELPSDISLNIEEISTDSEEFMRFLHAWSTDIEEIFPDFSVHDITFATVYLIKVNQEPSGLFIYQDKGDELYIDVDYLIPKHRDKGVGEKFFSEKLNSFRQMGCDNITSSTNNKEHKEYLQSLGFKQSKKHNDLFELAID